MVVLASPNHAPYAAKDRRLLAAIAHHAALAIERTRLSRELSEAQLLRESDALKSALLSSISHDLRTPLAAIKAFATGLLEAGSTWDPATVRESLVAIDGEADRLNRMVGNVLDVSRLEAGALRVHRDWVSIREAIDEALYRLARVLHDHPTTVDVPPDLPPVFVDYALIHQVLVNLLENVAKHTPSGTRIAVTARRDGSEVHVSVSDAGPGILHSEREAVFQRFYRLEESEGRRGGTGLGLAICKGFIEAHGGHIWVAETVQPGTTITFSIPLTAEEEERGEEVDSGRR
jgi:two-component system sensor histidine kinase KdpD